MLYNRQVDYYNYLIIDVFLTAVECEPLPGIANGVITYAADMTANYSLGTQATYVCNAGFFLDISATDASAARVCVDDNDNDAEGIFQRQPPTCIRK